MDEYRLHGDHSEDLDDGRVLEPGDFVQLDEEAIALPRAATLIEDGKLHKIEQGDPPATEAAIKLARSEGIELTAITPTGVNGQITQGDVESHIEALKGGD